MCFACGEIDQRHFESIITTVERGEQTAYFGEECRLGFQTSRNECVALGGRLLWPAGGALSKTTVGPKVSSSALGPKEPACSGPATNSQKGSKS